MWGLVQTWDWVKQWRPVTELLEKVWKEQVVLGALK